MFTIVRGSVSNGVTIRSLSSAYNASLCRPQRIADSATMPTNAEVCTISLACDRAPGIGLQKAAKPFLTLDISANEGPEGNRKENPYG